MQIVGILCYGAGVTVILRGQFEPEEHHLKRIPFKWGISAARNAVNMG